MPDYASAVAAIIKEVRQLSELDPDAPLLDRGIIDSLDIMIVTSRIEEDLGITLDVEAITAENFESVNSLATLLSRLAG